MAIDGFSLALGGLGAVAQSGLSLFGTSSQNRAIRSSAKQVVRNAGFQRGRIARDRTARRQQVISSLGAIEGRTRTILSSAGTSEGSSARRVRAQATIDAARNLSIIDDNAGASDLAALRNAEVALQDLKHRRRTPFFSALAGGAQGFSSGLSIASSIGEFL